MPRAHTRLRAAAAPLTVTLALTLAACGSSSQPRHPSSAAPATTPAPTTATTSASTPSSTPGSATSPPASTSGTTTGASPPLSAAQAAATDPPASPVIASAPVGAVPVGAVADVAGTPIGTVMFNHWMAIAVKSQPRTKGQPVIAPDYPTFRHCIAKARTISGLRGSSTARLLADCQQLFKSLSTQILDYLIRSLWFEQTAVLDRIVPSPALVARELAREKAARFHTKAAFARFQARTGETTADLLFRIRVNIVFRALARRSGGATKLEAALKRQLQPRTLCATGYVMADCSNYPAG